jgi:hypothetical protein
MLAACGSGALRGGDPRPNNQIPKTTKPPPKRGPVVPGTGAPSRED